MMRGEPFIKNGKTLISGIDPVKRADDAADAVAVSDRTLYLCPSPIYGYGLSRFLSRIKKAQGCAVLCVEADSELYNLSLQSIDKSLLADDRLHLTYAETAGLETARCEAARCEASKLALVIRDLWGARAFRRVETVRFSGGWQLAKEYYDSLFELLRGDIANDWSNAFTLAKMGRLYIRNAVRNLQQLACFQSISELSFGSCGALFLGAGPSLDETLDALQKGVLKKTDEGRGFKIICVDTCLGALKDRGITPDLVVILESQHWNLRDFIGCRGWNVSAAADICALPATLTMLGTDSFLFMTPWTELKIFNRLSEKKLLPGSIAPLGSVGLAAVEIARRVTRGRIICAGLDFSFTQEKYHVRSAPGHRNSLNNQTRFKRIFNPAPYDGRSFAAVSKSGFPVYSSPVMRKYRDLFEREFGGDSRIFDIDGTGLPLGIKTLSMEEAVNILRNSAFESNAHIMPSVPQIKKSDITFFIQNEISRLQELRDILTGGVEADKDRLYNLLDECDYLWAHFPDYSTGRKAQVNDISFLKRVRAELDPMLELLERQISDN